MAVINVIPGVKGSTPATKTDVLTASIIFVTDSSGWFVGLVTDVKSLISLLDDELTIRAAMRATPWKAHCSPCDSHLRATIPDASIRRTTTIGGCAKNLRSRALPKIVFAAITHRN